MQFLEIVSGRRSVKKFDPNHTMSDEELRTILERVRLTPSSFNLQHWRFVVARDPAVKSKLRQAAFNQEQVESASAVVVVLGKLTAYKDAAAIFDEAPPPVRDSMVKMIAGYYADSPTMQRDEAIRSASLAAMTLMYAAYDLGYATGPMIGFDPAAVGQVIGLDAEHIPVMMIVIGKEVGQLRPRAHRWPVDKIAFQESFSGAGL